MCVFVEDVDTEAQLSVQEEMIFDLKQQMQQKIEDLKSENDDLRTQLSLTTFKGEGTVTVYIAHA